MSISAQIDPITIPPAQLIFKHWEIIDQHHATYAQMQSVSHQGADIPTMNELNAQLDLLDEQIEFISAFLKLAGFTDRELN